MILDEDIASSAAIAGTKINPDFGSQNIVTTGIITGDGSGLTNIPAGPLGSSIESSEIADGTILNSDIASTAAIDATKIGDGSVNSTRFQYLNSLTGNIQSQIDSKANVANPIFTGIMQMPGGSASDPSFAFTGDTDTGIYSSGNDHLNLATAGTSRITIDDSGNVGIGVSNPNSNLDVNGTIRATDICDQTGSNCRTIADGLLMTPNLQSLSSNYSITANDRGKIFLVNSASTLTLPDASSVGSGFFLTVKQNGGNTVSILPSGGDTIDGGSNVNLTGKYASAQLVSDGSNWVIPFSFGKVVGSQYIDYVSFPLNAPDSSFTWIPGGLTQSFVDLGRGTLLTLEGDAQDTLYSGYRLDKKFWGDVEVRISFYQNDSTSECNDPMIVIAPIGATPVFTWYADADRINFAVNCTYLDLLGETTSYSGSYDITPDSWYTIRANYSFSTGTSRMRIYSGLDNIVGAPLDDISIQEAPWLDFQVYIAADQDNPANGQTQFSSLKIINE